MIEEYKNIRAINQSAIKDWLNKTPLEWKSIYIDGQKDESKKDEVFLFGSFVDALAYSPDKVAEQFYINDKTFNISPEEAVIVNLLFQRINQENEKINSLNLDENLPEKVPLLTYTIVDNLSLLEGVLEAYDWRNNWKLETRVNKIKELGESYLMSLYEGSGKTVVNGRDKQDADEIVAILRNHNLTKEYFTPTEGIELLFQLELQDEFLLPTGDIIRRKGAIDTLKIDHKNRTKQNVDLKTDKSAHFFQYNAKKYGYGLQQSYYKSLLIANNNNYFPDYEIITPINIVIDRRYKEPYIYEYDDNELEILQKGNEEIKGWEEVLEEITWHMQTGIWTVSKELHETGKIKLSVL